MKIDGAAVERMQPAERTALRQGSQQVEVTDVKVGHFPRQAETVQPTTLKEKHQEDQGRPTDLKELENAIEKANRSFKSFNRRFEYSIHDQLNKVMVKVIDSSSDQVIREIPPEKLLDVVANMLEVAGIIVDEKA
ncbi:flagellar protein FlaG [Anoxynatronum buryatiense]|uniref:Flagellar protein FlaG n=1 Tax=Anoxynatronum buryatiense TaxID=489973 RepID=A0AA46AK43_9CLOT|nr:flagellar protein FlaG [Anoxynatronum buryatiense]SMP67416.1 flagellar protein FlaG [Anoxynatronum buryatiense]